MRTCIKCQKEFSISAIVNGKKRYFYTRKFCLECSPFGKHNTQDLTSPNCVFEKDGKKYKRCPSCKKILELIPLNYYIRHDRGGFHYYCKKCQDTKTHSLQKELKRKAVEYKGGKCICCGYDKYIGALEFHHLDPEQKDFQISRGFTYNFEKMKPELDKCSLVCSNCHKEIHGKVTII